MSFVAAIFAVSPQPLESVEWSAERHDALSGRWLTLKPGAILSYAGGGPSIARDFPALVPFSIGLFFRDLIVALPLRGAIGFLILVGRTAESRKN
jgi:hypothetical protein